MLLIDANKRENGIMTVEFPAWVTAYGEKKEAGEYSLKASLCFVRVLCFLFSLFNWNSTNIWICKI